MADEELELDVNESKGNKTTTILLIVLIVLVLVIGGVGAWLFLAKDSGSDAKGPGASGKAAEKNLGPITYLSLVPEFVVNFGPGSKVRYLQVDLQIATRDEDALKTVSTYRPVLRNDILVLLSGLTFDELKLRSGKESLQKKLLNTINRVVTSAAQGDKNTETKAKHAEGATATEEQHVEGPIENVYFTSFIMQ